MEDELIKEICVEDSISSELVKKLLVEEQKAQGMSRRGSIFKKLKGVLNEDWNTPEDLTPSNHYENDIFKD